MNLHIEIIGLPGSGKSTCSRLTRKLLGRAGSPGYTLSQIERLATRRASDGGHRPRLRSILSRLSLVTAEESALRLRLFHASLVTFMADHGELFHLFFDRQIRREFTLEDRRHDLSYFLTLCSRFQMAKDKLASRENIVLDEGFSYIPIRTVGHGDSIIEENLERYLDLIPVPDLLVHLHSTPEVTESRMRSRQSGYPGPLGEWTAVERMGFWRRCAHYVDRMVSGLAARGVEVVTVENTGEIDELESALARVLPPSAMEGEDLTPAGGRG